MSHINNTAGTARELTALQYAKRRDINCSKRISVPSWKIHDVVRREIFFEGLPDCRACVCTAFWELEIAPRLAEVKAERQP